MNIKRKTQKRNHRSGDALRVSLALVFILFASIASRDHETPEKTLEAREIAVAPKEEHTSKTPKSDFELPSFLKRLTGINGAI